MAGIVHEVENHRLVEQAEQEAAEAAHELAEIAHLRRGQIVVIGCSTRPSGRQLVDAGGGGRHLPSALQRIFAHGRVSCRAVL